MTELHASAVPRVSLDEVLAAAAALVRVDRKYLVPHTTAQALLDRLAVDRGHRVLEIAGRLHTSYRSSYYDTADLDTCRAHLQQRRRRWKVREREYVEDGLRRVEVKTRDGSGTTTKDVADRTGEDSRGSGALGAAEASFVATTLASYGFAVDVTALSRTMEVTYRRTTLADLTAGTRVTLDVEVDCVLGDRRVWLDRGYVIVETKGGTRPGGVDRLLRELGARPRSLSKYASTASLLRADLADNDVRRLHGVQLHSGIVDGSPDLQVAS